jgi:hypothetical protein
VSDTSSGDTDHADRFSHPRNTKVDGPKGPMLAHHCKDSSTGAPKPGSAERCPACSAGSGDIYEVDRKGVCQRCGHVASVVSHGHEPVEGNRVKYSDNWVRCELSCPEHEPEVVCLCGSTRFKETYREENQRLTMEGKVVLSCGVFGHADDVEFSEGDKEMLDALHKQKIDLADRIHVINVDGYVGDSTQSEIEYARVNGKNISWLEPRKERSVDTDIDRSGGER